MGAFDDIIQAYGNPQGSIPAAQARFSRAPISFLNALAKNFDPRVPSIPTLIGRTLVPPSPPPPSGGYNPRSRSITLTVTPISTYEQMQHIANHEDVHAVLDSIGRRRAPLPPSANSLPPDDLEKRYNFAPLDIETRWDMSHRAGQFNAEIPAYLTAYRPGEIYGVNPDMAKQWVDSYSKTLPDDARSKIVRLGAISRGQAGK